MISALTHTTVPQFQACVGALNVALHVRLRSLFSGDSEALLKCSDCLFLPMLPTATHAFGECLLRA